MVNIEQHFKNLLGEYAFQLAVMTHKIEELTAEVAELKKAKDE